MVALSTPYIDAFGTGAVITASHTIYRGEPRHQHTTEDQVIGVLGADFPLSYFQKYVLKFLYNVIVCSIPRITESKIYLLRDQKPWSEQLPDLEDNINPRTHELI